MNAVIGILAIVVLVAILYPQPGSPNPKATTQSPLAAPPSFMDYAQPTKAGGAVQEAGASFNPTGGASVMITYDKV